MDIQTQQGQPASVLGLSGQGQMEPGCVDLAWRSGINYFFSYGLGKGPFVQELQLLLAQHREAVMVATGSEQRQIGPWQDYIERVRQTLAIDTIDILFIEYVSPDDDWEQLNALLEQLHTWKSAGLIRYVGATTHNRPIALRLIETARCDVLMHRYNMAHRKAEEAVFPAAVAAGLPIVAFTSTRWGELLQPRPDWPAAPPTAADCYRFGLYQPAVRLALTSPKTRQQLAANLAVLQSPPMPEQEIQHWRRFGDLVYGNGQGSFETSWP